MAEPTKRLGRGLSSLISDPSVSKLADRLDRAGPADQSRAGAGHARFRTFQVPLESIRPNPEQPRRSLSDAGVSALAESIQRNGLIQPIVVRALALNESQSIVKYELISGERRWRASRVAGIPDVPAIIRDADPEQLLELSLVENIQREDLNPIDKAHAYQRFMSEFGVSAEELGRRMGEQRSTVTNTIRLLELPESVRQLVAADLLGMGHARALIKVQPEALQLQLAKTAVADGMSVRALEELVRRQRRPGAAGSGPAVAAKRPHIRDLEQRFEAALQTRVRIQERRGGQRGRIVIEYNSIDDFQRVLDRLGIEP